MASLTQITRIKRNARNRSQGRKRKNRLGAKSTPSAKEVFAKIDQANPKSE